MDALTLVTAFWISGIGMAIFKLYLPAIRIIGTIDKNNIAVRYAWLGGLVFVCITAFLLPMMVHMILIEKYQERFLNSFIPAFMGEK